MPKWILPILILTALALACPAFAQESTQEKELPDAPSAVPPTCERPIVDHNGDISYMPIPCSEWPSTMQQQQHCPVCSSSVKTWEARYGKPAGLVTMRRHLSQPPLRTTKQTLSSKLNLALEVSAWGLASADAIVNRGKPGAPKGLDLFVYTTSPMAVVSSANYLGDRYLMRLIGLAPVGYAIERHIEGIVTGRYP